MFTGSRQMVVVVVIKGYFQGRPEVLVLIIFTFHFLPLVLSSVCRDRVEV